jgi:hypothetical protein
MNKLIVNCETGEISEIELTAAEIKNRKITEVAILEANEVAKAEAETKATAKAALLKRLGITAEEAVLLLS